MTTPANHLKTQAKALALPGYLPGTERLGVRMGDVNYIVLRGMTQRSTVGSMLRLVEHSQPTYARQASAAHA